MYAICNSLYPYPPPSYRYEPALCVKPQTECVHMALCHCVCTASGSSALSAGGASPSPTGALDVGKVIVNFRCVVVAVEGLC